MHRKLILMLQNNYVTNQKNLNVQYDESLDKVQMICKYIRPILYLYIYIYIYIYIYTVIIILL